MKKDHMKKNILLLLFISTLLIDTNAQVVSTSNQPSEVYSGSGIPASASVYGIFVGRTPCQEFMKELNLEVRPECAKRKMSVVLFQDSVTRQPTTYETHGMAKWSGKGKWHIIKGIPGDSQAIVFQLDLAPGIHLFLLKGDENVLFILDRNKNFLVGNASFSYTMNRAKN
jgi:hypothetical protein